MFEPPPEVAAAEPLVRVMALRALAYCERLFYLEEVEKIRVADDAVYAGRVLHQELEEPDPTRTEKRSLDVASETLGLTGRIDAVRHREGGWVPYEHKRGRCARGPAKEPAAWPSDRLQVLAYALLLEEATGEPVTEGRIRYHASNATVRVPVDVQARSDVAVAVQRARELRTISTRPPVTDNERLCIRCSLAPVCLPEEERLARDASWEPIRLFPPAPDGQVIHAVSHEAHVGRSGNTLVVKSEEGDHSFPIEQVQGVVLHGFAQMTTQALHLCGSRGIPVHWITSGGRYVGGLALTAGPVQRRIWQYEGLRDPHLRLILARRLVTARIEGQLRYLLRASRERGVRTDLLLDALAEMRMHLKAAQVEMDIDMLRGHEGAAGRRYFESVPSLFRPELPDQLIPDGRNRRPPRDRFNALLSFGYGLLYRSVLEAIVSVGLERLRFELNRELASEDALLIVPLCNGCSARLQFRGAAFEWPPDPPSFVVV